MMKKYKLWKRLALITLFVTLTMDLGLHLMVYAQEEEPKEVRVGWYDSSFCHYDEFGR